MRPPIPRPRPRLPTDGPAEPTGARDDLTMGAFRFLTAGESHGPALGVTIEGVPAGLELTADAIAVDLARRQKGYGRGARQAIEQDRAEILSGFSLASFAVSKSAGFVLVTAVSANIASSAVSISSRPRRARYARASPT